MEYSITFKLSDGTEETVQCLDDHYILDAAHNAGIDLPYSCRAGACSICCGKIISGEVDNDEQSFLNNQQLDERFSLLCVAYPKSDCIIDTEQEENL